MRKGMHKLMYVLGTTLILLGTLMSTVMLVFQASTVTGVSSSLTSSVTTSSKDDSSSSKNVVSSSKSSTTLIEKESSVSVTTSKSSSNESSIHSQASSESNSSQVANGNSSSQVESSATSRRAQNLAATASSIPTAQKIGETNIRTLDAGTDGAYDHFRTSEGDVTYCYNWQLSTPDKINGTKYNKYQFYDGMQDVTGDQQKVAKVAAALEAGYHKDADTGKYNVAPQFRDLAQSSFEDTVASSEYRGFIPSSNNMKKT